MRVSALILAIIGATALMGISPVFAIPGVASPPSITKMPVSRTVKVGHTARFSAKASGYPRPTVQWLMSTDGVTFVEMPGATSKILKFTATAGQSGDQYEAVFSNPSGTATTAPVALMVTTSPANIACTGASGGYVPGPYISPPPFSNPYSPFHLQGCDGSQGVGVLTFLDVPPPTVESTATVEWSDYATTTFDYTASPTSSPRCKPQPDDYFIDLGAFLITGEVTGNSEGSTVSGPIKALVCLELGPGTEEPVGYDLARGTTFHL